MVGGCQSCCRVTTRQKVLPDQRLLLHDPGARRMPIMLPRLLFADTFPKPSLEHPRLPENCRIAAEIFPVPRIKFSLVRSIPLPPQSISQRLRSISVPVNVSSFQRQDSHFE